MDKLFFDIESTGVDPSNDRIVQLSIIIQPEKSKTYLEDNYFINPTIPIPAEATAIHLITNEDVADEPTFAEIADELKRYFEDKILIGYNILGFDVPLLMSEFERAGVEVNLSGKFIDVYRVESKLYPRTLSAIYQKYTGLSLKEAHDARIDNRATKEVLIAQTKQHKLTLDNLFEMSEADQMVDYYGKFKREDKGHVVFNFGKNKGQRLINHVDYCEWMLRSDFPQQVKNIIEEELNKHL